MWLTLLILLKDKWCNSYCSFVFVCYWACTFFFCLVLMKKQTWKRKEWATIEAPTALKAFSRFMEAEPNSGLQVSVFPRWCVAWAAVSHRPCWAPAWAGSTGQCRFCGAAACPWWAASACWWGRPRGLRRSSSSADWGRPSARPALPTTCRRRTEKCELLASQWISKTLLISWRLPHVHLFLIPKGTFVKVYENVSISGMTLTKKTSGCPHPLLSNENVITQ